MSAYFDNYDTKFPELILDILEYFSNRQHVNKYKESSKLGPVYDFIGRYAKDRTDGAGKEYIVQPRTVWRICNKLCDMGYMTKINTLEEMDDYHTNGITEDWQDIEGRKRVSHFFNSLVCGFDYIHRAYN